MRKKDFVDELFTLLQVLVDYLSVVNVVVFDIALLFEFVLDCDLFVAELLAYFGEEGRGCFVEGEVHFLFHEKRYKGL